MQRILITAAVLAAATSGPALADGMYVGPYGWEIYEPVQTAFIAFDTETGREELSIRPKFFGDPVDFAWVVPVPGLPELEEADPAFFDELALLTRPRYRSRDSFWGCQEEYLVAETPESRDGVDVIGEEVVGIYATTTIGADDAGALTDSLTAWGFLHEGNREEVEPVLQTYVDQGWYFVAMQIDSTAIAEVGRPYGKIAAAGELLAPYHLYPSLQPITFRFDSPEMVYPLRISKVSAYDDSAVYIYAVGDHRLDFPGALTAYANRISPGELAEIRRHYPRVGAALRAGDFLTKLNRRYTPPEMDADIVLERADDDAEFLPVNYSGPPVWTAVFGAAALGWLAWRARRRPRTAGVTRAR